MKKRDEQLSAFLDGDLKGDELKDFLEDLQQNPVDDAETSLRYQMMGDVIRAELNATSFMDISASVHRMIAAESESASSQQAVSSGFNFSAWLRPLSGMAIAASVAMVTVVSFRVIETESIPGENQLATETVTQQPYIQPGDTPPVNARFANQVRIVSVKADEQLSSNSVNPQLKQYLLDHSGSAGQGTVQGVMPYVRVVSHGSELRQ